MIGRDTPGVGIATGAVELHWNWFDKFVTAEVNWKKNEFKTRKCKIEIIRDDFFDIILWNTVAAGISCYSRNEVFVVCCC